MPKLRHSLFFTNINVLLITIVGFVDFTGIGLIVPVRSLYARSVGANELEIGLMASSFILAEFLFQIPFGLASDKFGRRRMMMIGMAIRTVMPIMYLFVANPWLFIILRFIDGTGAAAVLPAARAYLMDSTPEDRRGEAFGILGMGTSAGLLLGPAIGGFVAEWFGYSGPYLLGPIMAAITLILITLRIHDLPHTVAVKDEVKESKREIVRRYFGLPMMGAFIMTIGLNWGFGLMVTMWSIWLADMGAGTGYIGLTFITFAMPLIVLSGIGGQMSDRLGRARFIIAGGILAALMHGTYAFATSGNYFWLVLGFGAIEGLAFAFAQPAIDGYLSDIIPANVRGQVQGVYNSVGLVVAFFSATFMATLYGYNHALPFIVISVVEVVCFAVGGLIVAYVERRLHPTPVPDTTEVGGTLALAE